MRNDKSAQDKEYLHTPVAKGTNFIWFTPDDSQNGHDTGIGFADQWFQSWLPQLQQAMSAKKSLLIVTADEDGPNVYTCFSGNSTKVGSSSAPGSAANCRLQ